LKQKGSKERNNSKEWKREVPMKNNKAISKKKNQRINRKRMCIMKNQSKELMHFSEKNPRIKVI